MKSGIIYKGPSQLDGKPIVVIATYSNRNTKTGAVVQTYILTLENPLEASKTGRDSTICGSCIMRGTPTDDPKRKIAKGRRCYVNLGQGVLIVFRAFERGVYPMADSPDARRSLGAGRFIRIGTYGDPAAVPDYVWDELIGHARNHTAYTHQIRMETRHRNAVSGLIRRSSDSLGSWSSHLQGRIRHTQGRSNTRGPMPRIQRGWPSCTMRRLQTLQRVSNWNQTQSIRVTSQINRNSGALIMNKYDKDAVQKEIKKSGVSAKEASLIHKLLKGHQS